MGTILPMRLQAILAHIGYARSPHFQPLIFDPLSRWIFHFQREENQERQFFNFLRFFFRQKKETHKNPFASKKQPPPFSRKRIFSFRTFFPSQNGVVSCG